MSETAVLPEIDQVRAQFLPLLELGDAEYHQAGAAFVDGRRQALEATAQDGYALSYNAGNGGNFQGYVGPNALLNAQGMGKDYKLDDPTVYDHVAPLMRSIYLDILPQVGGDEVKAYLNAAFRTAQHTQQQYFGSVFGDPQRRHNLLGDILDDDGPAIKSVADLKSVAICSERASVANNVLQILGVEPVMETGSVQFEGSDRPEPHVYLFVKTTAGKELLYDPTSPTLYFDEAGNLLQTEPALYPAEDALTNRDIATPVVGQHKTFRMVDGQWGLETKGASFFLGRDGTELHPR